MAEIAVAPAATSTACSKVLPAKEDRMAGYGLFVLVVAVGTATVGYYWLRND